MRLHLSLVLSSLFLFYICDLAVASYSGTEAPAPAPAGVTDFIRTSCARTLYQDLCYASLSGYAKAIQQDPAILARFAIGVSLVQARRIAAYVSNLTGEADYGFNPRAASALHDCLTNFGDAVDQIRGSLKQMRQVGISTAGSFRFMMSNVQTWMSAALTDEETCTDGFERVADGPMKAELIQRVAEVKMYTSNALALVNCYAEKGTP